MHAGKNRITITSVDGIDFYVYATFLKHIPQPQLLTLFL